VSVDVEVEGGTVSAGKAIESEGTALQFDHRGAACDELAVNDELCVL
jgi:hypothetical protein